MVFSYPVGPPSPPVPNRFPSRSREFCGLPRPPSLSISSSAPRVPAGGLESSRGSGFFFSLASSVGLVGSSSSRGGKPFSARSFATFSASSLRIFSFSSYSLTISSCSPSAIISRALIILLTCTKFGNLSLSIATNLFNETFSLSFLRIEASFSLK